MLTFFHCLAYFLNRILLSAILIAAPAPYRKSWLRRYLNKRDKRSSLRTVGVEKDNKPWQKIFTFAGSFYRVHIITELLTS